MKFKAGDKITILTDWLVVNVDKYYYYLASLNYFKLHKSTHYQFELSPERVGLVNRYGRRTK